MVQDNSIRTIIATTSKSTELHPDVSRLFIYEAVGFRIPRRVERHEDQKMFAGISSPLVSAIAILWERLESRGTSR